MNLPGEPLKKGQLSRASIAESLINQWLEQLEASWEPTGAALRSIIGQAGIADEPLAVSELVRVDLDRHYQQGSAIELSRYFQEYPVLLKSRQAAMDVAFEDFRARRSRGLACWPARWSNIPGIREQPWFMQLQRESPTAGESSKCDEPEVGKPFGEFFLVCQIGSGAFSRVYLATQSALGSRYVALKVTTRPLREPQHLAQLQHTGIVPLYSVHRIGQYSVLCMPYSGSTTVADWIQSTNQSHYPEMVRAGRSSRSDRLPQRDGVSLIDTVDASQAKVYTETLRHDASFARLEDLASMPLGNQPAASNPATAPRQLLNNLRAFGMPQLSLWLACRLAAALAHAHTRGIAHGDIKPANILIRNDGEPALIDFNLARDDNSEGYRYVGGTLPYMAPEQLQALMGRQVKVSASADVYALGLVLYESLYGRPAVAVPQTLAECDLQAAIDARKRSQPEFAGSKIPCGYRVILEKCLAYDPQQRYPSAQELYEDLDAQLHHRRLVHVAEPLKSRLSKLPARYPRAFSSTAVATVALVICGLVAWLAVNSWQRAERFQATSQLSAHLQRLITATKEVINQQPAEPLPAAIAELIRGTHKPLVSSPYLSSQQRGAAEQAEFEACLTAAWMLFEKARRNDGQLQEEVQPAFAELLKACQNYLPGTKSHDLLQQLLLVAQSDKQSSRAIAVDQLTGYAGQPAIEMILHARALLMAGQAREALDKIERAELTETHALLFWLTAAAAQLKLGQVESARLSSTFAVQAWPQSYLAYHQRAQASIAQNDWLAAKEDCTQAIKLAGRQAALYTQRALVLERLGQLPEAIADIDVALSLGEESTRLLFIKSRLYRLAGDDDKADDCLEVARRQLPITTADWISRALAQAAHAPEDAVADLEHALRLDPTAVTAWQNLAFVQSEYLGDDGAALESLNQLLSIQPDHQEARAGRCVLLARQGELESALEDIQFIQQRFSQPLPATIYQVGCAHAQLSKRSAAHHKPALRFLAGALQQGYGGDLLETDQDLDPIRETPEFDHLVKLADLVRP